MTQCFLPPIMLMACFLISHDVNREQSTPQQMCRVKLSRSEAENVLICTALLAELLLSVTSCLFYIC